ncbi:unnamed protein product [Strongylus vulgaris]|uniref:Uncharacterized protein n=1 Tax=Strongylus vulgaris TaxID=40348 RepID=A0A3P7L5J8_STRVU|nr:unnamed protein product [Strongylus vulgaris]
MERIESSIPITTFCITVVALSQRLTHSSSYSGSELEHTADIALEMVTYVPAVGYRTRRVHCRRASAATRDMATVSNLCEMSAVDSVSNVATEPPDAKVEEEERYRLKMIALQECYDSVALQSVRLRERIYQVKKQCRRLEVMKRVALNMLHQNTGTYDIPPLEIVDEDPLPSFLESLHKQQYPAVEPPRKKSKRPSRSKADGKLTPEEEERAKQKICSIIDSVYSETARRMGDTSKRPSRNPNVVTPTSSADSSRKVCDLTSNLNHKLTEEVRLKTLHDQLEFKKSPEEHPKVSSIQINGQRDNPLEDDQDKTVCPLGKPDGPIAGYESLLSTDETMTYDTTAQSSKATYHSLSAATFDAGLAYSSGHDRVQELDYGASASSSPVYDASAISTMKYQANIGGRDQDNTGQSLDYMTNSTVSPLAGNHSDSLNSSQISSYSSDETSSPKQLPKRRRKYKYVVESVLDNVPYTFRQAESDDDEVADKNSTTVSTSVRTSN